MGLNIAVNLVSTIVVAVATVVLACLTSRYVRLTRELLDEARQNREPFVFVDFEFPEALGRFVVGNSGGGAAHNIRVNVTRDLPWLNTGRDFSGLSSLPPVKRGLSYLTQGRVLKYQIGRLGDRPKDAPTVLEFTLAYRNDRGREFSRSVTIDVLQFRGVLYESFRDPAHTVATAIREVDERRRSDEGTKEFFDKLGHR